MAAVETLRLVKSANVGCEKHGNILEARAPGDLAPEWLEIPHNRLSTLTRQGIVERVTLDDKEMARWDERHEEQWGAQAEEEPEEEESDGSDETEATDETEDEEDTPEVVEEDIEDLGPVEVEEEEKPQPTKRVARRRTSTRRSKT